MAQQAERMRQPSSGMSTQGPESLQQSHRSMPMPQAPQGHQFQASPDRSDLQRQEQQMTQARQLAYQQGGLSGAEAWTQQNQGEIDRYQQAGQAMQQGPQRMPQGPQFQASMDQLMQQGPQTFQSGQPGSANSFDNAILQSQGQMGGQMPMDFQPERSAFSYEDADPRQAARGQRYMGDMRQR